jgi:hypothetical protein
MGQIKPEICSSERDKVTCSQFTASTRPSTIVTQHQNFPELPGVGKKGGRTLSSSCHRIFRAGWNLRTVTLYAIQPTSVRLLSLEELRLEKSPWSP